MVSELLKEMGASEAMRPRVNKYLYREAKYFMVKSNNHENVRLAKAKGVWSTPPQNEIRFNKAVEVGAYCDFVISLTFILVAPYLWYRCTHLHVLFLVSQNTNFAKIVCLFLELLTHCIVIMIFYAYWTMLL